MSGGGVRFGIAGWTYDDWRNVVYPRGCKDELRFLARHVDFIEINSTFYRLPRVEVAAKWVERTADLEGFFFTAKLPGRITHEGALDAEIVRDFRACMAPLAEAGRLRAVLVQFSYRFEAGPTAFDLLRRIDAAFGRSAQTPLAPLILEVRHKSWSAPEAWGEARALGFGVAALDYPGTAAGAFDGVGLPPRAAGELAYYRIHGRNSTAWFDKKAGRDEVYDYAYSAVERGELQDTIRELAAVEAAADTLVVANNHFEGKAVKLALELAAAHTGERVTVPDPLLARYPDLSGIARGVLF